MKLKVLYNKRALVLYSTVSREASLGTLDSITAPKYLVLGDLHIGFEEKFQATGVALQSNQPKMMQEILKIIEQEQISHLVLNGDIKAGVDRILKSEWEHVPKLFSSLEKSAHVYVIPGNHDGGISNLLSRKVELLDTSGLYVSGTLMLHGHTQPLAKYANCERIIMGHVHPIFKKRGSPLSGLPVWVFLKVKRKGIFPTVPQETAEELVEVVLMPSFNMDLVVAGYSYETANEERRAAPLVRELRNAEEAFITTLEGEVIGDAAILTSIL